MDHFLPILLLAFLGSIVALIGGVVFLFSKVWSKTLTCYSTPFAAGVLITVAILGLLPEAEHSLGESTYLIVLLSFLASYVFEHFLFGLHHHDDHRYHIKIDHQSSIPLIIIGDTIHNFVDGIVIAASYLISPGLGIITTISTFLHEVPHEIADFGILLSAGWKKGSIIVINVISASATILGALLVVYFTHDSRLIGIFLAIASGLFLYLGASDFLPHIEHEKVHPRKLLAALLIGAMVMIIAFNLIPHSDKIPPDQDHFIPMASEMLDNNSNQLFK